MNILRLAAQIFLIYLVYKLVVNVIIPIYRSAKTMKSQFREMQSQMQDKMQQDQRAGYNNSSRPEQAPVSKEGDYIDYEEIK